MVQRKFYFGWKGLLLNLLYYAAKDKSFVLIKNILKSELSFEFFVFLYIFTIF